MKDALLASMSTRALIHPLQGKFHMTKLVRFTRDIGPKGSLKFAAGQYYALDAECQRHVDGGGAELVDEAAPEHYVPALEARSRFATARAETAAANARELQQQAQYAQRAFDVRVAFESLPPSRQL